MDKSRLELQKYKDRLEQAQKAGRIGVFEWDMEKHFLWWSEEEEELFGLKKGSFKGDPKQLSRIIYPKDYARVDRETKNSIRNKTDLEVEFRVVYPDGDIHWLRTLGHIYFSKSGKPQKIVGINYDITARKLNESLLKFKAEASRVLASSLDYKKTFNSVAKLAVRYIADWCSIDILDSEGNLQLVAITHKDPKKVKWATKLREINPPDINAPGGLGEVLRTGKSQFYPHITEEMITQSVKNKAELKLVKQIGFTSIIIVPLNVEGSSVGAITFVSAESKRIYNEADLDIAEQLASRASLAIENASLYERVYEERSRLINLLKNVPAVVWESYRKQNSGKQRVDFVSSHIERMLGYSAREWHSIPDFWLTIIHPEDREKVETELRAIYESGEGGTSRFRWIKKKGGDIWVETQSFVIKDKKDRPIGLRGVSIDITDNMDQVRRKDEFISMASHELKTPLTSLKVFTQVLKGIFKKKKEMVAVNYLQKMDRQIDKLNRLVSDLLDVTKIQAGRLELEYKKFDLAKLVQDSAENIQATSTKHKILVKGDKDVFISADKDRIEQVLVNLLTNAIKYSPNTTKVILSIDKTPDKVSVRVKDYGVGIAKIHQKKIFERFYRVYDTKDKTFPGLGIGLHISYEIIKRHNGQMGIKSSPGKGATFYFSLPYKK